MNDSELEIKYIQKQALATLNDAEIKAIQQDELNMLKEIERIAKKHQIPYYLAYGSAIGAVREKGFIPWDTDIDLMIDIDSYSYLEHVLAQELPPNYRLQNYKTDPNAFLLFSRVIKEGERGIVTHVDLFPMVGISSHPFKQHVVLTINKLINQIYYVKKIHPEINYQNQKWKRVVTRCLKVITSPIPEGLLIMVHKRFRKLSPLKQSKYIFNLGGTYGRKEIILKRWLDDSVYLDFETEKFPLPESYHRYLTHMYGDYLTPIKD